MLTVVHITTGLGLGGAERTLFQVCDGLREYRHHVVSLTGRGNWGQRFEDNGNEVVSLNITSVGSLISGFFRLRSFLRVAKPDLVQTWMPHANLIGGLAARSVGIRRVFWNMRASGYGPLFRN